MELWLSDLKIISVTLISLIGVFFVYTLSEKHQIQTIVKLVAGSIIILLVIDENGFLIFGSIVIVGLLIASELFMAIFASLMRGDSNFLSSQNFEKMLEKMSTHEIQMKQEAELKEIQFDEEIDKEIKNVEDRPASITLSLSEIESKALSKMERGLGIEIDRDIKFEGLLFDGAYVNSRSTIINLIEVKYFPKVRFNNDGTVAAKKIIRDLKIYIEKIVTNLKDSEIKNYELSIRLCLVCVFNTEKDLNGVHSSFDQIKQDLNSSKQKIAVRFVAYNLDRLDL